MRVFLLLFFCISLNCLGRGIEFNIENFMGRYCTDCHDEDIQKGDRRFDDLSTSITDIDLADRWQEVLDVLNLGEMPPKKKEQPSKNELFGAIDWLTEKLKKAESDLKGHTSTVVMRRMTREEYDQTVHSIFGFESKRFSPARHLPKDETYHGFKNIGEAQITSAFYLNSALEAATEIVNFTLAKGDEKPQVKTVHMPPKSYRTDYGRTSIWREYRKNVISLFNNSPIQAKAMSRNLADGVHADGFYEFEVEAEAYGRNHKFPESIFRSMHRQDKFILQVGAEVYESTRDGNTQNIGETLKFLEIEDDIRKKYKVRVWLNKGESISMLFWNGPTISRDFLAARQIEKYYPELMTKRFSRFTQNPSKRILASSVYKGPRIRIWDAKITGPYFSQWPLPAYKKFFDSSDLQATLQMATEKILRRPVSEDELKSLVARTENYKKKYSDLSKALGNTYRYLLTHPEFLYIVEEEAKDNSLTKRQYAQRLSYFLNGIPADEDLLTQVSEEENSSDLVEELLNKDKSDNLGRSFADQWLHLHKLGAMPVDRKFKYYHKNKLEAKIKEESQLLIVDAIQNNVSLQDILTGRQTWVDRSLARHYGMNSDGLSDNEFVKVKLSKDSPRRGILGHSSILTLTSNGVETSPVMRGVWVMENILGIEPPPPPPDVPAIEPDIRGAKTVRQQLEKHRQLATCNSCHQKIDPLGLALEAFDPVGTFRKKYPNRKKVDTSATYRGEKIANANELVDYLAKNIDQVAKCVLEKMLTFSTGRRLNFADQAEVKRLQGEWKRMNYKMRDLVKLVVDSSIFRSH